MARQFLRWYEKNEYLRAFMSIMQDLEIEYQCELAVDIIIRSSSMIDRDYTKMIQEIAEYNPRDYKRWYDKNPNVHIAIESLKDLTDEQREEIIQEFTDKILNRNLIEDEDT